MHPCFLRKFSVLPTMLFVVLNILLLCDQSPGIAQDYELFYEPDPTFSALSKKGTPKDIMRGGGKRGCLNLATANPEKRLQAIVPQEGGGGLSADSRPTFWIQTPYVADRSISAVLSLRKADSFAARPFQKVLLQLPAQAGMVGVQLPQAITERGLLAWTLTVVCDVENPARNPFVSGLVMVKPNNELLKRVVSLSKQEQVVEFMRSGYWYDALTLVAPDGHAARQEFMKSVGLQTTR
jgi:Domain of Unknown Function (DUF928)